MQQGSGNAGNSGNFQKIGEGLGGLFGQAADTAAGMLGTMMNSMGGWWAQAANQQQQTRPFGEEHDRACRNHFDASFRGGTSTPGGTTAAGGVSASVDTSGTGSTGAAGSGTAGLGSTESGAGGSSSYDRARPLYQFGHLAGQNPDYQGRSFEEIEPELQRGWTDEHAQRHGSWPDVRGYVSFGYSQSSQGGGGSNTGGGSTTPL